MDKRGQWAAPLLLLTLLMSVAPVATLENQAKDATGAFEESNKWTEEAQITDGDAMTCSSSSKMVWRLDLHRDTDITWIRLTADEDMTRYTPNIATPGCPSGAKVSTRGSLLDWVCERRVSTRYILIRFPTFVRMCEIFVYRGSVVNAALRQPARQSSTFDSTDRDVLPPLTFRGDAALAVDGGPTNVYQDKTCAVTDWSNDRRCTESPWWQVDFAAPVPILAVRVIGRGDNVANFGPLEATLGQRVEMIVNRSVIPVDNSLMLVPPLTVPSLRLAIPRCSVLQLCEVEAFTLKSCLFDVTWGEDCKKPCPATCLGGRCHPGSGLCLAGCVAGYMGSSCETDIDECGSAPCRNGGSCTQGLGLYTCTCPPGFTGPQCETNIQECNSLPCQNGAQCKDLVNSFSCTCLPGFTGVVCETNVNECASSPCVNGGTCVDRAGDYSCTCLLGYVGKNCETNFDDCRSYPCRNGGQCLDLVNDVTCTCRAGFAGPRCEIDVDECTSLPCQNGGSCRDTSGGYYCTCGGGFSGTHCELDQRKCASNPCPSDTRCISDASSYVCVCPPGTSGSHCHSVQGGNTQSPVGGGGAGRGGAAAVRGGGAALSVALLLAAVCLV